MDGTGNSETTNRHSASDPNPFQNDVEKIATSFFVTNFPDYIDAKQLWQVCEKHGRIVDAFIPNKRSKAGKRFGFVRFIGIKNKEDFAKSLADIWIGSYHMFASVAHFQRHGKTETKNTEGAVNRPQKQDVANKTISLSDDELVQITNSMEVALVKVKSVETMSNLYRIIKEEGFDKVKIHYIGGLWLWLHFQTIESCNVFKSNTNLKSFFSHIKPVSKKFYMDERMVWVEILGLPLCAWGSNAFKKIASSVGRFMFFEKDETGAMSLGRVCVATKHMNFISETTKVSIHGEEYDVFIHELGTWNIDIEDSETDETDSKVDEDINNEENSVNEEDFDEKEEGEKLVIDKEDNEKTESDLSRPPGFEHFKETWNGPTVRSKSCSTSFCKFRKKDIKGISVIHEMSKLIEVGEKLGQMKVLSINIRGTKKRRKQVWIKEMCFKNNIEFLGVQESKMTRLELFRIKNMWGNYVFDYACSLSRGRSGGLISIWDPNVFAKDRIWCDDRYIIVKDHTPLLLHHEKVDYGPVPFKFFHSWLQREGFNDCVVNAYTECSQRNSRLTFHDKLKTIKQKIKHWNLLAKQSEAYRKHEINSRLSVIEGKIDSDKFKSSDTMMDLPTVIPHASLNNEDNIQLEKAGKRVISLKLDKGSRASRAEYIRARTRLESVLE
ncbi:hypothetical protein CTI12_AA161030 [Artemisia annua]|uniref:RRM domain-containing protein n=1 Tax=Artemisia annua TaxID=35608 RepID=A0A2U1PER5_ARTAN|nr:hypothetical protein CTI12_AA161030 [Artemisia annua]